MIVRLFRRLITVAGLIALCSLTAHAESVPRYEAGPLLGFSAGAFDLTQGEDAAIEGRLEYRQNNDWWFKPLATFMANTDGAAFAGIGIYSEIFLTENFYLSPSFTPGVFLRGQSKNLGHPIEFRSQMELGWRFESGLRTSVSINHISNAGMGNRNPGTESVVISLLVPFGQLF
ncbi:MAG: acyloxyacyl hydrolase [Minwuia sp.]|uniref:acyloxyacyl hydrolase n=1 Tax=Minwuia sp. TaxID=2493630 RepID=UPI003A844788